MNTPQIIMMVLRSGGDFSFDDVRLLSRHIKGKWQGNTPPRVICMWDKASTEYSVDGIEIIPLSTELPGTWARMMLYSPQMEKYRPFLYIDLDTAVINSIEKIIDIIPDKSKFITLQDFWQVGQLATGLVWFPAKSEKIQKVWKSFQGPTGRRMDLFLRKIIKADYFWQNLTDTIYDFKPRSRILMNTLPENANLVCFHGKPRIPQAMGIDWVNNYVVQMEFLQKEVTVIIPYKTDRGWLQEAIDSVPKYVQLLISQGDGNWPANFNKALPQATGKYIKYLHEDDMLSENCINDSLETFSITGADFIHGCAAEFYSYKSTIHIYQPKITNPSLSDMLIKNHIHSATLMYSSDLFKKIGNFDESLYTAEEYEFNLRCLKAGLKLAYCPSVLAYYRRHPAQKVRMVSPLDREKEREMVKNRYRA